MIILKFCIICALCFSCQIATAQVKAYRMRIIDEATGEALPCVHAQNKGRVCGVSNADGYVSIFAADADTIVLSSVGYIEKRICACNLGKTIRMQMNDILLDSPNILSNAAILKRVLDRQQREYKSHKKEHDFFFNRFSIRSGEQREMVECLIKAKSVLYMREVRLLSGKYYGVANDSSKIASALQQTNLHKITFLSPMMRGLDNPGLVIPFSNTSAPKRITKKYQIQTDMYDDGGNLMYRMVFKKKDDSSESMLQGIAYIDASTFCVVRFEGILNMTFELARIDSPDSTYFKPCILRMIIDYSNKRGFSEVSDAFYEMRSDEVSVRSHLYNTVVSDVTTKSIAVRENVLDAIKSVGNESELDKCDILIERTENEKNIVDAHRAHQRTMTE